MVAGARAWCCCGLRGSGAQLRNTRGGRAFECRVVAGPDRRMSCCCGVGSPSVALLRIQGGLRLNNATFETVRAQQRNTRGGRGTECGVVAGPDHRVSCCCGVPTASVTLLRIPTTECRVVAGSRPPNVVLLRSPDGECDVVADSGGSQTQQRNIRDRTDSTTQHSRRPGLRMSQCCGFPRARGSTAQNTTTPVPHTRARAFREDVRRRG